MPTKTEDLISKKIKGTPLELCYIDRFNNGEKRFCFDYLCDQHNLRKLIGRQLEEIIRRNLPLSEIRAIVSVDDLSFGSGISPIAYTIANSLNKGVILWKDNADILRGLHCSFGRIFDNDGLLIIHKEIKPYNEIVTVAQTLNVAYKTRNKNWNLKGICTLINELTDEQNVEFINRLNEYANINYNVPIISLVKIEE